MKTLALILALLLGACVTNPNGSDTVTIGKTSITIPASDVSTANAIVTDGINAALTGTITSLATTGTVNAKTLGSSELYSIASTAQANVGNIIPPTVVSSSSSVQSIGQNAANILGGKLVTQTLVNNLYAAAAKSGPTPAPSS